VPVFDTPTPISVVLDVAGGTARITAGERADTVVDVHPAGPGDTAGAEAHVDLVDGALTINVSASRPRGLLGRVRAGMTEVTIDLPTGSHVRGRVAGDIRGVGRLGECRLRTAWGDIRLDETGPLQATTTSGEIEVGRAVGPAEVTSRDGEISIGMIEGPATIVNTNGETRIGEVTGDLTLTDTNGEMTVDRARGNVEGRTAHGGISIGEVVRGTVSLATAGGELAVGVAGGTAAWLDIDTAGGGVHNELDTADGPGDGDETVKIHARTGGGDIRIHRS